MFIKSNDYYAFKEKGLGRRTLVSESRRHSDPQITTGQNVDMGLSVLYLSYKVQTQVGCVFSVHVRSTYARLRAWHEARECKPCVPYARVTHQNKPSPFSPAPCIIIRISWSLRWICGIWKNINPFKSKHCILIIL